MIRMYYVNGEAHGISGMPPRAARMSLKRGDLVKICFQINGGDSERLWVRVTQVRGEGLYRGALKSTPTIVDRYVLPGDTVTFESAHVLDIRCQRASEAA